ncbi:MAG: hypothetical protein KDH96_11835, partial [Candidatus Riesia sp.]|nr:hypothetical protein [Candidatus Riesia sp.]
YVRLYYTSPKTVSIPFGTVFENALGKQYKTTSSYTFTQQDLQNNTDVASYYSTGDVYVEAVARGTDYESSAGTVTKLITKLSQTPAFVNNVLPITGSTVHENNSSLYTKIINSAVNRTVYASQGIEALLMEQYPTIENVEVVGKTHEKMLRDLSYVYSASGITYNLLLERSDYFGSFGPVSSGYIYSGLLSGPFYHFAPFNECVAYSNGVTYSGTITSGTLPSTAQFVNNEFNLEQYAGLYKNDSNYAVVETSIILNENFDNPGLKDRGWTISDSSAGLNNLRYYKEVDITGGKLRLGYNSASGIQPVSVIVTPDLLSMISGLIDRAVAL